ncbi:MAG: tyrosine-type recombinase/integrase [Azonexus sp.]|nr:tyrosine-type recombinase/integrase [Azonexus sp.]
MWEAVRTGCDWLDEFWFDCAARLRPNSLRNLRLCVARHLRWLNDAGSSLQEATLDELRRYLAMLVDRRLADATLVVHRWALGTLYRWVYREGLRIDNPVVKLAPMIRRTRGLRWAPTVTQIERILHAPDVQTALGVRDRCILELLYATGMRASELLGLQAWQVDSNNRIFKIVGKGQRERLVLYGEAAAHWLHLYLREVRARLIGQGRGDGKGIAHLFVHPVPILTMTYTHLWRMVRRYGQCTGLPLLTPHVFRHAFATHCKDAGMDLITLQTLLGHASVATTTIYLHSSMDTMRALLERHHPRGIEYQPFQRDRKREP